MLPIVHHRGNGGYRHHVANSTCGSILTAQTLSRGNLVVPPIVLVDDAGRELKIIGHVCKEVVTADGQTFKAYIGGRKVWGLYHFRRATSAILEGPGIGERKEYFIR